MNEPLGNCECGWPLADGGVIGIYCSNPNCPMEGALLRQACEALGARRRLPQELRDAAAKIRRSSMPLADLIPLLQRAADALDT